MDVSVRSCCIGIMLQCCWISTGMSPNTMKINEQVFHYVLLYSDSWCGLSGWSSPHCLLALGLLDHWAGRDPCPASLFPLPRYVNCFYSLPPNPSCPFFSIRDWELRWMARQWTAPQMGWFIVHPFHLGRAQDPGGPAWRALGTFAVSDLMAPGSQSTLMPSTKRPLQNGRHPSCG